jgi:hypothetical protein
VQLLKSIDGVGVQRAVQILVEIEDINRFASTKKLSAYFGLHPMFKQSGDGNWGSHMSKQGRSEIRAVLYMAAFAAIRCNPVLKPLYQRLRKQSMSHYPAMGVVMHKLLRIIYGVLKNQTPFSAQVDQLNQSQAMEQQKQNDKTRKTNHKIQEGKKHRYQSRLGTEAPVSGTMARKRKKEQVAS